MGKKKDTFKPFSEKKQKRYERMARLQYGPELVNESVKRWSGYSKAQQQAIMEEGGQVYRELAEAIEAGLMPQDEQVQAILPRWHNNIRHFYEPTLEILRGLGQLYTSDPEFHAFFDKIHDELADYLQEAINLYVDRLEDAELARLMAEDERQKPLS